MSFTFYLQNARFSSGPAWTRTRDLFLIRETALCPPRIVLSVIPAYIRRFSPSAEGRWYAGYRRVSPGLVSALMSNRTGIGAYSYCVGSDPGRSSARPLTQAHPVRNVRPDHLAQSNMEPSSTRSELERVGLRARCGERKQPQSLLGQGIAVCLRQRPERLDHERSFLAVPLCLPRSVDEAVE